MTNAVAEPASVVADTQTEVPPADPQATPTPGAGTDGGTPALQAPAQTADTSEAVAPTPSEAKPEAVAKPADTRSEAEIRADERNRLATEARETKRLADLKAANDELRNIRREGPKLARSLMADVEKGEISPLDAREQLENHIENLNLKAYEAAKLELGDKAADAKQSTDDLWMDRIRGAIDPARAQDFEKDIEAGGFTYSSVAQALVKYAPRDAGLLEAASFATEAPALASDPKYDLNEKEGEALVAALKGAKTAKAILAAGIEIGRKRGQRDPGAAVESKERGPAAGAPTSMREAEEQFAASAKDQAAITQLRRHRAQFATSR